MGSKINPETYVGYKQGRLTILGLNRVDARYINGKQYGYIYSFDCICDCGNRCIKKLTNITSKKRPTLSCGCISAEKAAKRAYKHGETAHKKLSSEWVSWNSMIDRCYREKSTAYQKYGAVGITVCDRWRGENGFTNFLSDMGRKTTKKHTIDRIDGTKGYSPKNCRWADRYMQANNLKNNVHVEWMGKDYTVSQLMRHLNIYTKSGKYYSRLKMGWDVERTFTTP